MLEFNAWLKKMEREAGLPAADLPEADCELLPLHEARNVAADEDPRIDEIYREFSL